MIQSSLLKTVEPKRSSALNEKPDHRLQDILNGPNGGKWLESDADEQLLIHLTVRTLCPLCLMREVFRTTS